MSEKLRLQEPIRSPLETPRLITPLPYRSGTSFLAWAIVNNNQPVPDVFSKMTKIAASGRLGQLLIDTPPVCSAERFGGLAVFEIMLIFFSQSEHRYDYCS